MSVQPRMGYCGALDTFYVATLEGPGRIYRQTFIDTYASTARQTSWSAAVRARLARCLGRHGER